MWLERCALLWWGVHVCKIYAFRSARNFFFIIIKLTVIDFFSQLINVVQATKAGNLQKNLKVIIIIITTYISHDDMSRLWSRKQSWHQLLPWLRI